MNGIFCYSVLGQPISYFPWPTNLQPDSVNVNFTPTPIYVPPDDKGTPFGGKPDDKTAPPPKDPGLVPDPLGTEEEKPKKEGSVWPIVAFTVGGIGLFLILSR